jgi:hypothetical protein
MAESTPQNQSSLPSVASNRPSGYNQLRDSSMSGPDDVISRLEGTPQVRRGSRKQPSIIKYPIDIGSAQVPHVMQFKIFWRWERPDLKNARENMKSESQKNVEYMNKLSSYGVDQNGNFSVEELLKSPFTSDEHKYMDQILRDKRLGAVLDPSGNSDLLGLLKTNPARAKSMIEQVVKSEQNRVATIDENADDLSGKVGLDESERLAARSGLTEQILNTKPLDVGINTTISTFGAVLASRTGSIIQDFRKGGRGAGFRSLGKNALGALGIGVAAGAAGTALTAAAKYVQNAPQYDQMVSIYLPTCTKINQTDVFQYKDANMAIAGGAVDVLGGPISQSLSQGAMALGTHMADKAGLGDAVASMSGMVVNPRLEKIFQSKGIREFTFSWDFYPRNQQEVGQIKDIIETFRYHSHPATSAISDSSSTNKEEAMASTKIMLRVPAEFEIRFLSSSNNPGSVGYEENPYIPKVGRCVITNIQVDYSPNGVFSTFENNAPTAMTLTLTMSEVMQLTRETVEKGY